MTDNGDRLADKGPIFDTTNPGDLEAFYSGYGASFCEHWRKVTLSNCKEIVRASSTLAGLKLSEARIDDLARLHDKYLSYLATHLDGRRAREDNVRQSLRNGA